MANSTTPWKRIASRQARKVKTGSWLRKRPTGSLPRDGAAAVCVAATTPRQALTSPPQASPSPAPHQDILESHVRNCDMVDITRLSTGRACSIHPLPCRALSASMSHGRSASSSPRVRPPVARRTWVRRKRKPLCRWRRLAPWRLAAPCCRLRPEPLASRLDDAPGRCRASTPAAVLDPVLARQSSGQGGSIPSNRSSGGPRASCSGGSGSAPTTQPGIGWSVTS